jgi:PAS domain S-box-containing protein
MAVPVMSANDKARNSARQVMKPSSSIDLRVLIVEDFEPDALRVVLELERGGLRVDFERVETAESMREALSRRSWDAIISDYSLPRFSAPEALAVLKSTGLDLPFIIVSGAVLEEDAIQVIRAGAHDFISKGRFARLLPALERELRDAEARRERAQARSDLDAVLECAPSFIIATNRQGQIQFINQVLPQYDRVQVLGTHWLDFMPEERRAEMAERHARVMAGGAGELYELCMKHPDGSRTWFSSHMGPMRDAQGVRGVVIVAHDVTELRRTQEEFTAAQRMVAVGTLAAGIAHEINTPTQFVSDSVHFLKESSEGLFQLVDSLTRLRDAVSEGRDEKQLANLVAATHAAEEASDLDYVREQLPHSFTRCVEGLHRVTTIVRSMKEFAYPAQRTMSAVDLNRAIGSTLVIAQNEYRYVADLVTELGDLPPVMCHLHDINQVVLNLVVNAAHAIADVVRDTDRRGLIRVTTEQRDGYVEIRVSDSGTGIPTEIQARIFEPFFTTKEVGRGTGQGLALAWTVIRDRHAGELTFETTLGQGTTFLVRLPIAGADSLSPPNLEPPQQSTLAVELAARGDALHH